jgi:hypothetical protein
MGNGFDIISLFRLATTMAAVLPTALAAFSSARSPKTDQPEKVLVLASIFIFDAQTQKLLKYIKCYFRKKKSF